MVLWGRSTMWWPMACTRGPATRGPREKCWRFARTFWNRKVSPMSATTPIRARMWRTMMAEMFAVFHATTIRGTAGANRTGAGRWLAIFWRGPAGSQRRWIFRRCCGQGRPEVLGYQKGRPRFTHGRTRDMQFSQDLTFGEFRRTGRPPRNCSIWAEANFLRDAGLRNNRRRPSQYCEGWPSDPDRTGAVSGFCEMPAISGRRYFVAPGVRLEAAGSDRSKCASFPSGR